MERQTNTVVSAGYSVLTRRMWVGGRATHDQSCIHNCRLPLPLARLGRQADSIVLITFRRFPGAHRHQVDSRRLRVTQRSILPRTFFGLRNIPQPAEIKFANPINVFLSFQMFRVIFQPVKYSWQQRRNFFPYLQSVIVKNMKKYFAPFNYSPLTMRGYFLLFNYSS